MIWLLFCNLEIFYVSTKQSVESSIIKLLRQSFWVNYAESTLPIIVHRYSVPCFLLCNLPESGNSQITFPDFLDSRLAVVSSYWGSAQERGGKKEVEVTIPQVASAPYWHTGECVFQQESAGADFNVPGHHQEGTLVSPQQQGWGGAYNRGGGSHTGSLKSRNKFPSLAKELNWGQIPGNHEFSLLLFRFSSL